MSRSSSGPPPSALLATIRTAVGTPWTRAPSRATQSPHWSRAPSGPTPQALFRLLHPRRVDPGVMRRHDRCHELVGGCGRVRAHRQSPTTTTIGTDVGTPWTRASSRATQSRHWSRAPSGPTPRALFCMPRPRHANPSVVRRRGHRHELAGGRGRVHARRQSPTTTLLRDGVTSVCTTLVLPRSALVTCSNPASPAGAMLATVPSFYDVWLPAPPTPKKCI